MAYDPNASEEPLPAELNKPKPGKPSIFQSIKNKWDAVCPFGKKNER